VKDLAERSGLTFVVSPGPRGRLLTLEQFREALLISPLIESKRTKISTIRDHRHGRVYPRRRDAWAYGETLYNLGFPIFSGLRALFRCGRLDDFYGVLGRCFLRSVGFTAPCLMDFWRLIDACERALEIPMECEIHLIAGLYVVGYDRAFELDPDIFGTQRLPAHLQTYGSGPFIELEGLTRKFESSRIFLFDVKDHQFLNVVWEEWLTRQTPAHPRNPLRPIMDVVIAAARDRTQSYDQRLALTRRLLRAELREYIPARDGNLPGLDSFHATLRNYKTAESRHVTEWAPVRLRPDDDSRFPDNPDF